MIQLDRKTVRPSSLAWKSSGWEPHDPFAMWHMEGTAQIPARICSARSIQITCDPTPSFSLRLLVGRL